MIKHLLTVEDFKGDLLDDFFALTARLKRERGKTVERPLDGKSVGLIFAKSSTRTRVSFEVGVRELGGNALFLNAQELQLGRGETIYDTVSVLNRYLHAIVIRTFEHKDVEEFARHATIPVINALTNQFHPCQALTDVFTMYERLGRLGGARMTYLGDGASNMANSLALAAVMTGMEIVISAPEEFMLPKEIIQRAEGLGPGRIVLEPDPVKAVKKADFLYTDVWVSMGFEAEAEHRLKLLAPYQLNMALMKKAPTKAKVLHCLPARRGMEITDEVMDSPRSIVFDQAENRLHAQKAILTMLVE